MMHPGYEGARIVLKGMAVAIRHYVESRLVRPGPE